MSKSTTRDRRPPRPEDIARRHETVIPAPAIADVIAEVVRLAPTPAGLTRACGWTLRGPCPFHADPLSRFEVNPEESRWRCNHCGRAGDIVAFVRFVDALGNYVAPRRLARRFGLKPRA
jgi:DNA primase